MNKEIEMFLQLIRLGIGNGTITHYYVGVLWEKVKALSDQHGLSAVLVDGIENLPENNRPPQEQLLQWIGELLQGFEYRYEAYKRAIAELGGFYNPRGYQMMVLKGYVCSLDWPKPEHRPCGDIDIWLCGKQKEADIALTAEKGIRIDKSHHHHTVFCWQDFMVENHYDFVNTSSHKSSRNLEVIFKELGKDYSHFIEVFGQRIYLPSPNLHALFLIRHNMNHFASSEINLRQLLDWAFFVKRHGKEVDWLWLESILEQFGMKKLYDTFNAICVEDLGFEVNIFTRVQFEPLLKERVLKEILVPKYSNVLPSNIFKRVYYKYRRWKANDWKRKLCYNESAWSSFWTGVISHLMKPSSI